MINNFPDFRGNGFYSGRAGCSLKYVLGVLGFEISKFPRDAMLAMAVSPSN